MVHAALAVALALTLPSTEPEDNILDVDKPVLSAREKRVQKLEAHVFHQRPATRTLEIERGDSVFVPVEVPLRRRPRGDFAMRIADATANRRVAVVDWLEAVELSSSGRRSRAKGLYVVRLGPEAQGRLDVRATVLVVDPASDKVLAKKRIVHVVEAKPARATTESIELDRKAYVLFQKRAKESFGGLRKLHDHIRLDRVVGAPRGVALDDKEREALLRYQRGRLRADIARQRLRAAADSDDPSLAEAAVLAIGTLSKRPSGPAAKARGMEGRSVMQNLAVAKNAVEDLRVDEAEGVLNKLRMSGKLNPVGLARALRLLGAVYAVRGRTEDAARHFGQSVCLDSRLGPPSKREPIFRLFTAVKGTRRCAGKIALTRIRADRTSSSEGLTITVRISFGPDPYRLVSGGNIELWGAGGEIVAAAQDRAEHEPAPVLEASFADTGHLENVIGQLLVRAVAKDVSGVALAHIGDPDPVPTNVAARDDVTVDTIPWWLWVAGSVAVAGAATATMVFVGSGEDTRAIGPVSATF